MVAPTEHEPVVLVVRHPDFEDQILLFGLPDATIVIYLDLGSGFDLGNPSTCPDEVADVGDWLDTQQDRLSRLSAGHPARLEIEDWLGIVREAYGISNEGEPS
jgi:hypothetical protein